MTSWLDTALSLFLDSVDGSFLNFWTNVRYVFADCLFQLYDSLGIILMYSSF